MKIHAWVLKRKDNRYFSEWPGIMWTQTLLHARFFSTRESARSTVKRMGKKAHYAVQRAFKGVVPKKVIIEEK